MYVCTLLWRTAAAAFCFNCEPAASCSPLACEVAKKFLWTVYPRVAKEQKRSPRQCLLLYRPEHPSVNSSTFLITHLESCKCFDINFWIRRTESWSCVTSEMTDECSLQITGSSISSFEWLYRTVTLRLTLLISNIQINFHPGNSKHNPQNGPEYRQPDQGEGFQGENLVALVAT